MLSERILQVTGRIADACAKTGRPVGSVDLLAVTKNHPRETVEAAIDAGLRRFGENRVQEAITKYEGLADSVELRLIGHIQSNKVKLIAGRFHWVESIDRVETARALSRRLVAAATTCSVLLQFNSSQETSKYGFGRGEELLEAAGIISALPGVELRGLMTIGPFTSDETLIRLAFSRTRSLFEQVRANLPDLSIDTLSMGMTDDLEIAVAEGSTEVRIGTAIFGGRSQ